MSFTSFHFLAFFPIVTALFMLLGPRYRWSLLLLASYYFYASWKPWYLLLIVATTLVSYWIALRIAAAPARRSLGYVWAGVSFNLAVLFVFKYFDFFNTESAELAASLGVAWHVPNLDLVLPVAISFYTFQVLSYLIDVYRGQTQPEKHLGVFALYVVFYPQLVAGPIERSSRLLPQLRALLTPHDRPAFDFDYERVVGGLRLILLGFVKKLVIADNLAIYVDTVYSDLSVYNGGSVVLATYLFAFQILFDFSAYTDIARGCAKIMGIDLMQNFNRPYAARSISDFWRRWHISLTSWFRDYVYIPLGGNRVSANTWFRNIVAVFVLSGIWHGAAWTFIVWGVLHGVYYLFEVRAIVPLAERYYKRPATRLWRFIHDATQLFLVFNLVCLAWLFFRADTLAQALAGLKRALLEVRVTFELPLMRLMELPNEHVHEYFFPYFVKAHLLYDKGIFVMFVLASILGWEAMSKAAQTRAMGSRIHRWSIYYAAILAIALFGEFGAQQFIYFQF